MVDAGFKFVKILQLLCDTRFSFCGTEFTTVLMFINELWNSRSFVPLMVGVYESSFRQLKLIRLMNSRIWKLDDITHMMTFSSNFWFETKYESYYLTPIWWLLFNESAWRHEISRTSSLKSILNLICTFSIIYFNFTLSISDDIGNDGITDHAVDHEIHVWSCLTAVDHAAKTHDVVRTQRCHYCERDWFRVSGRCFS